MYELTNNRICAVVQVPCNLQNLPNHSEWIVKQETLKIMEDFISGKVEPVKTHQIHDTEYYQSCLYVFTEEELRKYTTEIEIHTRMSITPPKSEYDWKKNKDNLLDDWGII